MALNARESESAPLMVSVSGCRGIVGESLTPEVVVRFAGAVATWAGERAGRRPRVVAARDGRAGGAAVHAAAIAGLLGAGADVIDLDVAMTASAGLMVDRHAADAGVVATASHNPQEWNGLKPIARPPGARGAAASAPPRDEVSKIIERFRAGDVGWRSWRELGAVERDCSASATHVEAVLRAIDRICPVDRIKARGYAVVLDSVNASGRAGGRLLLESLGCRVTHLGAEDTGLFTHPPEPTRENLTTLCDAVKKHGAAIGFAQDPDADRLAAVDEAGRYVGEEHTLALAVRAILDAVSDPSSTTYVANLSTSRMIDDVAQAAGARVVRAAVGEANVVEAMRAHGATLGGEGNGGVIWPEIVNIRDSLSAMALTLALMARRGASLGALVDEAPSYAILKAKAPVRPGLAEGACAAIAKHWSGARLDHQDGVRVDLDEQRAWIHVRESNTEPIMRVIVEAPAHDTAQRLLDEASRVVTGA